MAYMVLSIVAWAHGCGSLYLSVLPGAGYKARVRAPDWIDK